MKTTEENIQVIELKLKKEKIIPLKGSASEQNASVLLRAIWISLISISVLQITTQSTNPTTDKFLIENNENQLDYTKPNNTAEVSMEKILHRGSENNVNPPNFSEEIEKMGITINEKSLEEKKPNGIKSPVDTSTKSWSERRQERRKRYKEKKVKSSPTSGYFSNYSSVDEYETTMTNDANTPFDDSDTAPTITHRINSDLVISDNSDGQPEYYILDTHNMCEQRNSIQVTNLDDIDNNITNSMVNSDSLDDLLEKNAQFCKEISELGLADWILLLPKEEEEPVKQQPEKLKLKSSEMKADQVNENEETNSNVAGVKGKSDTNLKSTSDAPVSKSRRVSLRSKRSFDYSFELWDESYFAVERKISQLEGLHYAAFNTNKQNRPNGHEMIDLIEDQGVTCLDADNPDKWVVRAHRSLQKMGSFQRELKKENTSTEFNSIDENESNECLDSSEAVKQEFQINNEEIKRIGRVPAVCLTRHLKSAQRGKRNPREAFREDVISFSNKQQEARMKMRYALTELSDTELEYSRALKQLVEVFDSLNGKMIVSQSESSEQTTDYPQMIKNDIEGLQTTLRNILQFSGMFLEKLPLYALEPGKSAECFTKNPDRWHDYTMFLLHLDNLINHTSEIASQDTEISFSLTIPDSLKTKQTSPTDQTDSYPQPYQRNSVSLRNILDLTDVPRNRLNAYCGLLRDIARYIARDGSSTKNLELAMTYVTRSQRRAEEFAHFWSLVDADFSQIFSSENLYEDKSLFGKIIPPPITRMTDIKIGEHKNVRIDAGEMKTERLILLPDHLLSAKCISADQPSVKWKLSRIINLDEIRLGDYGNDGKDQTSFELWNISGKDPLKLILHITCPDVISRNAWVEDMRNAIKEKTECSIESTNVDKSVVDSHIKAFWDLQKRYTGIMELSPCRSESVSEIYFDALENVQQANSQNVESSQFSQIDKDVLVRTSINQKSTSSSSYYTADEPMDDKDRAVSGNLFESYSTLDGVQTPFSEDQQSLADFQMSPDVRGNLSQLLPRSSLTGSETLIKQLTVNAGEQIQFNASFTISGPVAYETSWFMNGAPMKPDLGADMILSDRDTRLLISNADPLVHSGTYACRCRLFEGTETAVYFCVNVLTAKMNLSDSNENELDQARRMSMSQPKIFYPVTKDLDIAVGKPLTIEVKIDEENALKLINNSKENVQVDWYQDSTLLKSSPMCEMIKSNDRFFLHSTTSHLQPDKIYMYTCMLRLPANSAISPAPSLTIPVRCHYPTVEELENEFKTSNQNNTSKPNGIITHPVALPRDEAFQLSVPIQNDSENHDYVIWWTRNDKLLAGSHLPTKDCVYECIAEPKREKNQTLVKLLKSSTKDNDSGTYKCWAVSQSIKNRKIHRIDVTVKVNEKEKDLDEKRYEEEREKDEKESEVNEEMVIVDDAETESPVQQDNKRIDDTEENIKQRNEKSDNAHFPETELQLQHKENEEGKETVEMKEKKDETQKVIIEFQKVDSGNQNEEEYKEAEEKNSSEEKTSEQIIQIQDKTLEKKTADRISVDNNEFSDNHEELSNVELCMKEKPKDEKRQKPEEEKSRDVDSESKQEEEKYTRGEKEKSGVQVPEVAPKSENEIIMNQLGDEDRTKNKQEDETKHRSEDNYGKTELTQTTEKEHDAKNKDVTEEENNANNTYVKKKASLKEVECMQQTEGKENQEYPLTSQNSNTEEKSSLKQPEDKMTIKNETKTVDEVDTELPPLRNKDITTNLTTSPDEKQIKSNKSKRKSVEHGADKAENLASEVKAVINEDEKQKILEESVLSKDDQAKPITADSATDKTEQIDNKHMKSDKSKRRSSKHVDEASDVKKGEQTEQVDDKKRKHKAKEKAVSEYKVDTDEDKKKLPVDSNAESVDKVKEHSETKTIQEVNQKRKGSEHKVDTDESKKKLPVDSNAESVDKVKEHSETKTIQEVNQKRKGSEHKVDTDEGKKKLPVDSNAESVDKVKEHSETKTIQEVNQKHKGSEHKVDTDEGKKQLPVDSNAESVDKVKEHSETKTIQEVNQKRKGSDIQKTENDLMMEKSDSDTLLSHGPNIGEDKTAFSEVTLDNEKAKKEFKASDNEKKETENSESTMNHEIFDAKANAKVDQARDLASKEQDAMEEKKKKKEKSRKSSKQKETERKLSKDTIKLDSDLGKTFTPLNEQSDDTALLNEYQQDKQPRKKHRKSVVKTENDDSGNKKKILDDQKEYTDITEEKLALDYEKEGNEIRNLLESQEVKESYMKNQEMEIPSDLLDEDKMCKSNVVFLKPVSDINKEESVPVKQGATVNLTTELDTSESSVLHPNDIIALKNGKPIEFSEKEMPILTIKDNLIKLVLEEISPEQSGIYEIGLRQPTKYPLKSGENEDETLDEPTSSSVIPFARFPLICVEPNESVSKDYTIKQIQDEYKQPKIFLAELLPKYVCMQGETMKLAVELKSNVCVKDFEWLVNGKTIDPESSTDFVVWQTGNWIALTIPNVRADLTGTYTLNVDTPRGRYTTTCDLSVNGQKRQTTPYVPSQVEGLKPLFTKKLQDYTAEANEIVRLCARLVAEPPATIIWKHNGIPIKDDNRIKIYQDHVNPSITIQNVKDEDYGEYSCVATNVLGQTETKATLYIQNNFFEPVGPTNDENKDSECIAEPTRGSALPSRVNNLQLVDVYEEGFKISWDPILDEQVTYNVEISNDAGRWWKPVLTNLLDVSADISNDMASPLNPVQIRIVAENEYGLGPPCFPFIRLPIRACLPHMQAIKPETEFEEATAVRLRWAPAVPSLSTSQMNKSGTLDKSHLLGKVTYSVEIREGSQSEWYRVASDISGLSYTYHLKPGVSSAIRIVAKNKYGESCPTPMTIVQLDPDSLVPDLSLDSPWVAVNYPVDNIQGKRPNVKLFWKAAYMPEYCDSCIKGLKPLYRIEWRRGKSGPWLELARDITEYESGYPLPKDIVDLLINETKSTPDLLLNNISLNHSVEFRVFCYNEFGESGPTKSYRLKASQLFRGQCYRNNLQSVDTSNGMDQYEHLSILDKLPVISSAKVPKLEVQVTSIDPKEGIALKWAPCTNSYLSNGVDNNHDSHGRYRIQRMLPSSVSDSTSLDVRNWTVVCKEDGLIYGEEYVLDIRPSKMEQFVRILTLNEDSEGNHIWLDNHEIIRIPALYEICPPAPSGIEVKLLPPTETSGCTGVCVSWKPPNHEFISDNNYLKHVKNHDQIDYRIEVRTTLSEMAPWRQVGLVPGLLGKIEDRKAEPGSQLIYRITPINQFGEGPSLCSSPVRLPLLLTSLERCIEDLRFLILGPSTIQLRWRLGDSVIDALGFKKGEKQSNNTTKQLDFDESAEMCERVNFSVERRDGYAGEWYPIYEQIEGNLLNKILLNDFSYLDKDISCRITAYVDGQQTKPSRPISISIKTDYLVPDFSAFKPHVNVTSVEEYVISWEDPDVQSLYTSHILNLTMPQVLHKDTSYSIQIQQEGSTDWKTIASDLLTTQWTWSKPNPLVGYHIRVQPFNQFGAGHPTRSTLISPQVVIPDLKFMRPSIECPSDILVGRVAPELVWQIPKSYALDRTFTPYTFEVQVKGVEKPTNRDYIKSETDPDRSSKNQSGSIGGEQIWRVLASGLKRNRLSLEHLDPEQEYWLRVVAVTQYGRGTPSQPVRKMADLNARRNRCASASIGVLHEPTPTSPTFTEPNTSVIYAPVYGHLDLKCTFRPVHSENETRFSWYFNGKLLDTDVNTAYPTLNQKFYSTVSKSGDTAILHLNGVGENDFGSYVCKAVHMMGTGEKEFLVKMADAPVFLEVPTPLLTVKLHSRFELPCFIDALPPPTIIWTRDSKRVVESHRTQIGKESKQSSNRKPSISTCEFSTDATLSVDKCIYQDAGLYTLVAENIAGRIMTSCLIHVEENPVPTNITLRWTNIEKHYFVLRRLEIDSSSEVRLLIDKKTNREYIGKLFNLDNPTSRINGAREMECLMRLCHKNVLKLVDALISDNVLILVCEKLSGSNLLDSVLACENWSEMAAAAIIRSVLEALDHIHKQGVVHYDIQPDNLLFVKKTIGDNDYANSSDNPDLLRALSSLVTDVLSQTDRHKMNVFSNLLKVIGFSTAQTYITNSQNRMTCMPPIRYRPEYVAPEILLSIKKTDGTITDAIQAYCENLGPSADIWSLGVLTYILLVGWPPFVDYESGDILTDNILQAVIPFDIPEFENISDEGKDFIKQTLQADPTKRPSAKECLSHPWIEIFSNSENKSEYILKKLKKYKTFYDSVHPVCIVNDDKNYGIDLRNRLATMVRQPTPSEDTESVLSSRSSSALGFQDNSESYSEDQSQMLDRYGSRDFTDSMSLISSNPNIPTAADASESILEKFGLERQNTLTEATQLGETTYPLLEGQESISTNIEQGNQTTSASHGKIGNKFSAPVFASPLKDSYFNVHTREARFTCQLANAPYIPESIPGHEEALRELYPSGLNFGKISRSSSSAAAWYLGGCLLSDGPGVSLGAGHGGWLWLCLSDLRPEQDRSVVECVVRNRAGKSRTKARLLLGDTPKPPGRPGLIDVRPTEALISWLASTPDSNEDLIYRVDIKYSDHDNEPPTWHRHGFTVDCRYLATNLKPGICYRVRISAGNTFGWGNYSIASSDFRTPLVSTDQSPNIFSVAERNWIFTWRQSANIYALSDHPVALQYAVDQASSVPPPPDKVLQKLHQHNGIIASSDVLKSICKPIRLINKGTYTKLTLGKSHPMLSEGTNFNNIRQNSLSLPPRLLCKTTYLDPGDKTLLQKARREALILTILHGASGGMYSSFEDYFGEQDNSYLFTNRRQLLPSGWSFGWLADDAAKPTQGITVMQWIPGGRLIDVLCSRVEYTEFSVMMWCQQILMALRWFHTCFAGQPHGNVCPEHILVARRTSSLPDIVLSGFGKSTDSGEPHNYFAAPELNEDQPKSTAADLWSVGAVIRLLLTGENPSDIGIHSKKPTSNESTEHHKSKVKTSQDSPSTIQSEENPTFPQSHISIKKLKRFSKPARKFVYNCLSPVPRKRGTVDFWLDSHWFDMNAENVNNLTSAIIPTNLLRSFKTTLDASVNSCAEEETRELQFS
ncbi:unnamed protein product [Trichobilharzia szidati]|nr:unnamed protein product [Trichobilharzia szidati]